MEIRSTLRLQFDALVIFSRREVINMQDVHVRPLKAEYE